MPNTNPTINGKVGAFAQPVILGNTDAGAYSIFRWEGTRAEVYQIIPLIIAARGTYELEESFSGAKTKLTGRFPYALGQGETPINEWEYFAQEAEKNILESDLASVNGISDSDKRLIQNAIENPTPGGPDPALTPGAAVTIYKLMLTGVRSVRVMVPSLRHTITASQGYSIASSLASVGAIISTATLKNTEAVDGRITLPTLVSSRDNQAYGWLKKHPSVHTAARQRIQIVREWEYGLWSTLIYGSLQ